MESLFTFILLVILIVVWLRGAMLSVKEDRAFHQNLINEFSLIRKTLEEKN